MRPSLPVPLHTPSKSLNNAGPSSSWLTPSFGMQRQVDLSEASQDYIGKKPTPPPSLKYWFFYGIYFIRDTYFTPIPSTYIKAMSLGLLLPVSQRELIRWRVIEQDRESPCLISIHLFRIFTCSCEHLPYAHKCMFHTVTWRHKVQREFLICVQETAFKMHNQDRKIFIISKIYLDVLGNCGSD